MLGKGISVGPSRDEGGVGSLGSDNRGVEVCCGNGIKEEGVRKGKNVVIIVCTSIVVQAVGKSISAIGRPRLVKKINVVVAEGENIVGKTVVDFLRAAIVLQVLVVGEDINNELSSQQEVAPLFECMDDGKEFAIPDWIVMLRLSEGGGVIAYGVS